ncbi:protein-glutamine gamma-glutamyltransferase [Bacillus oleivorans]|uniref:Protein-glutamine gamma-glutamyltransferase n=1 Tax=Bacillus oleivorans TaxID=1448271 RepID=A0A285CT39_9BACI|nr:protein-glutamine gamma-glutamyltransferase [Bacillus oleivorans]SNX70749.1 protein-glutamine gamma-glutamyltransferase [Bacillus oleivorans]
MIVISGRIFQHSGILPAGMIESSILQRLQQDFRIHPYQSIDELRFELEMRKNIILSARAMSQGRSQFVSFAKSYCNPRYWRLTEMGGFRLRPGVRPSVAIEDIFRNSSLYGFECATAIMIIYYRAVLKSIGRNLFDRYFANLYLYSWIEDQDLGLRTYYTYHFIPGDVVYFENPEFHPETPWWRGESAVVLENGTFFGHGVGIGTAEQMLQHLNKARAPWSTIPPFLRDSVLRPSFKHLFRIAMQRQGSATYKKPPVVIHHNESSISYEHYSHLKKVYNQMASVNPFLK